MQKQEKISFGIADAVEIPDWCDAYPEKKFTVYRCTFLSDAENYYHIPITADMLRRDAKTILGTWLVAKIKHGDAQSHEIDEQITGYFPIQQEIEFTEEDGITKATAYAVVSKVYSKECNGIFEYDNFRSASVEMTLSYEDDSKQNLIGFDIDGLTILGRRVKGANPDANVKIVRFSKRTAEKYFSKNQSLHELQKFVEGRRQQMAEPEKIAYKIDKSKEAMSDADWGDVDKAELRDKIMDAANRNELVKEVYALVEDGWEDAPSEHLKYPLMELKGDTFVYSRNALASAMAYARQNDEQDVIEKLNKIYADLDPIEEEKKEMAEEPECPCEDKDEHEEHEDEEKEEEHHDDDGEAELSKSVECAAENTVTDAPMEENNDAEPTAEMDCGESGAEDKMAEAEPEPQIDERDELIAQLKASVEEKENIIMERDEALKSATDELTELRKYKAAIEEKEKAVAVESIMAQVNKYLSPDECTKLREEGMACLSEELDAFANKVKAIGFTKMSKSTGNTGGVWRFGAPVETAHKYNQEESGDIWERLRKKNL